MKWLWNWGGECFGYQDGEGLWTYDGKHVGNFYKEEVYGRDGAYLGEIMSDNRLITHLGKSGWRKSSFTPYAKRGAYARYANYAGYAMYAGYEDFPSPDSF
jgi:hypothetical protein